LQHFSLLSLGAANFEQDGLTMKKLDVIAFAGASNWPIWAGQEQGLFVAQDIDLNLELTPTSSHMAQTLRSGTAQIALTSIDNVIAYANGHGEVPLDGPVDFFAFMGVDDGLLSVMAQPEIETISGLRGRTLAVDALTTGFAFVLKEILAQNGVSDDQVTYVAIGTGAERLAALQAAQCSATLLNAPLCLAAESAGKTRLVRAKDILGSYQGIVGAARRSWASDNSELVASFIRGFHSSLRWLADPRNRSAACKILEERLPIIGSAVALAYDILITDGGLKSTLEVDRAGTACVIALRSRYGNQPMANRDPGQYVDDRFRREALA
jgi:ABC-type nitrate/sulfonate/bicarbonate transport system substrate-binding protein